MKLQNLYVYKILNYFMFLSVIALICVFKNEIWNFVKSVLKAIFLTSLTIFNFIGEDNLLFILAFMFLAMIFWVLCSCYGLINVLIFSLYLVPIFIATYFIFDIELTLNNFNGSFFIFIVILNGLLLTNAKQR
ncbi:hypothetical protein [Campylobacter insulaenigrae]|uniref:hypothetical protein n=1 Tax=Campylobacter insulaenigrae TaxID=260714 RepID=UPI0021527F62|nr:hypothetical protein [Campylobacter insulaenigrae]MCR6580346.1 hypothetical protein [Campylobacter insulaenigrae]